MTVKNKKMNNKDTQVVYKNSFPFFSIMFLILFTLKLTNVITWSWWLVTAPLWGPIALGLAIISIILLFAAILKAFN